MTILPLTHRHRQGDDRRHLDLDARADHLWRINWKKAGYSYCGVYVISTDSLTPCKIGHSVNPAKRLGDLQISHWRSLQISAYRWCESKAEAADVEREVHRILILEGKLLLGEWFDIRPDKAAEVIDWAGQTLGLPVRRDIPDRDIEARIAKSLQAMVLKTLGGT